VLLKYPESIFRRVVTCSLMPRRTDSVSLPKRMMKSSKPRSASISGVSFFFQGTDGALLQALHHPQSRWYSVLAHAHTAFWKRRKSFIGISDMAKSTDRFSQRDLVILCLSNVSQRYRWPRAQRFTIQGGRRSHAGCCDPRDDKEISGRGRRPGRKSRV
jgi:hypothetical protein